MDIEKKYESLFKESEEAKLLHNPGLRLDTKKFKEFLSEINECLVQVYEKIKGKRPRTTMFIGSHPKSITKESLASMITKMDDFFVCEKSDGVRYLLIITNQGECLLSGRNDEFNLVKIPIPKNLIEDGETKIMYIFDGELVLDHYQLNKKNPYDLAYLIFDCIVYNGRSIHSLTYEERLDHALRFINFRNISREILKKMNPNENPDQEIEQLARRKQAMNIYLKDFFSLNHSYFILDKFVKKIPHANDGLIFTQNSKPYIIGGTDSILKWKEPTQNTIDFFIVNNMNFDEMRFGKTIVDLYVTQRKEESDEIDLILFDFMVVEPELFELIGKTLDINEIMDDFTYRNKSEREVLIAECRYDPTFTNEPLKNLCIDYLNSVDIPDISMPNSDNLMGDKPDLISLSALNPDQYGNDLIKENLGLCFEKRIKGDKGNWIISKFRRDKKLPNALATARNVLKSIAEDITKEELKAKLVRPPSMQYPPTVITTQNPDHTRTTMGIRNSHPGNVMDNGPTKKIKPNS